MSIHDISKKERLIDFRKSISFLKLNRKKLVLFLLIYNCLMTIGHILLPVAPHVADINNHSELAIKFGFPFTAAIYTFFVSIFLIASIALIAPYIRDFKISLFKLAILFGLLWFFGIFEALFPEETYLDLLVIALNDSVPAFLLVFLISKYVKPDQENFNTIEKIGNNETSLSFLLVITIGLSFIFFRVIGYYLLDMKSRINDMPLGIILWTCLMGLFIGFMYVFYQNIERRKTGLLMAIRFTCIVFGINWIMFNLFVPLLLNEPCLDFVGYRGILDSCALFIGVVSGQLIRGEIKV